MRSVHPSIQPLAIFAFTGWTLLWVSLGSSVYARGPWPPDESGGRPSPPPLHYLQSQYPDTIDHREAEISLQASDEPLRLPGRAAVHQVNRLPLMITNNGRFTTWTFAYQRPIDVFTGKEIRLSLEFPRKSRREFVWQMGLMVGGRTDRGKTHVSAGGAVGYTQEWYMNFVPPDYPGTIEVRSTTDRYGGPDEDAVSEEDFVCEYNDNMKVEQYWRNTGVVPNRDALGVVVRQESHGWSYTYAEDIIFMDLLIENGGTKILKDVYVGLYVTPEVGYANWYSCVDGGDVVGLLESTPSPFGCDLRDTINMAWWADNDGNPNPWEQKWQERARMYTIPGTASFCLMASARDAMAIVPLLEPGPKGGMKYNWWSDGGAGDDWYLFEPSQDPAVPAIRPWQWDYPTEEVLYRMMATEERDYPSYLTAEMARRGSLIPWLPAPQYVANRVAVNSQPTFIVSWGPFTLWPGAQIPLSFAVVAGEKLHTNVIEANMIILWPDWYEKYLDFSDLVNNARWAQDIFDTPGYDTDDDGYAGEFRVCVRDSAIVNGEWVTQKADTQWYKGDGIPDYRVAEEPIAPDCWVTPVDNGLRVRFNGQVTENTRDAMMQRVDFEGYRVYVGRDERKESLSMVAGYDREDYDKWFMERTDEEPNWRSAGVPFTKAELRCLYGDGAEPCEDSAFDPLVYTVTAPYHHPRFPNDSIFRFERHDNNASEFGLTSPIRKRFPGMPDPRTLPVDSITPDMYTEDGYLKFYEYEFTIDNLLASVGYWVNVTAYDFGSPAAGVHPLESDRTAGLVHAYPLGEWDSPMGQEGKIYVYPNPYRTDADYRDAGLEGRTQEDRWDERVRAIWFANLPPKCTIHIFTLDGDRVRTIEHDCDPSDADYKREKWGLINRNQQKVEAGLYYWVVEVPGGETQVGKLVIIR